MSKIDELVATFVTELRRAIAEEAAAAFASVAMGDRTGNGVRAKPGPKPKGATSAKPAKRAKWAKRSPEQLEALSRSLISAIRKEPGLRSEQLAEKLGTTTKELALPLGALVDSGHVRTAGERRGMKYSPTKKAS